jgi:hypothetical protein
MHESAGPDLLDNILASYSGYSEFSFGSLDSDTSDFPQYRQANAAKVCCLLLSFALLGLRFNSKDGCSTFFQKVYEML